jgi:RND family efflux transporter MFP subunit
MNTISTYIKAHKIVVGILLLVAIAGGYLAYRDKGAAASVRNVTQAAQVQTLTSTVSATGSVAASDQVDIKPSSTATVTAVDVKLGQQVSTGQTLLTLDETTASQQLNQAKASLQSAQANYQTVLAGATTNDQQQAQLSVTQAQQNLTNAQTNVATVTTQQKQDVATAYQNLLNSDLQLLPSDTLSTGTVTLSGEYNGATQGSYTVTIYESGNGLTYSVSGLGNATGNVIRGLPQALGNGLYITFSTSGNFSTTTSYTVNVPNQMGSSYENNQTAYNNALTAQTNALQQAQQQLTSSQDSLQSAQLQYEAKIAPPTDAQVAQAQAQVSQAQASYENAVTTYDNNIIKSPIDGTVAAVNVSVGDQANAGSSGSTVTDLMTIITPQQVANVTLNEVNAAKVQVGQKATLTFDAVSGLSLTGTVAEIDTVGTVTSGVVTYGAQITLDANSDQIKPGMSTTVNIITKVDQNVMAVPTTAIKTDSSGNSYVQVLGSNGQPQNVTVQTGDSNGTSTVITSGLSSGQEVVTQTISTAKKNTAAAATTSVLGGSTTRVGGAAGLTGGGGFTGGAAGGVTRAAPGGG